MLCNAEHLPSYVDITLACSWFFVFFSFSCSDHDVVWKILCMVCRKGMRLEDGEESSCTHSAKPPPLLEEELALTVSSLIYDKA